MKKHSDLASARFSLNMRRIKGLVDLYFSDIAKLKPTDQLQSDGVSADILRTIVVFLHASFEYHLRTVARRRIAAAESQVLDQIPLVGTSSARRPEKFHLGALDAHRTKTVDQVIQESVESYLDRQAFSSCEDVEAVLRQMGLDTAPFKPFYSDLDQMMQRRHRIVHEADLLSPNDSVVAPWTLADALQLCVWNLAVVIFHNQLAVSVDPTNEVQRFFLSKRLKAIELARAASKDVVARDLPETLAKLTGGADSDARLKAFAKLPEVTAFLAKLTEVTDSLGGPSDEELIEIFMKMKSPVDHTTREEVREQLAASRVKGE